MTVVSKIHVYYVILENLSNSREILNQSGKSLKAANFETGCNNKMTQDYEPLPESMYKGIIHL